MFYQCLYDFLLNFQSTNIFSRILYKFGKKIEKYLLKINVPIVHFVLFEIEIEIPWTHNLPIVLKNYNQYSQNIARIGKILKDKYPALSMIDIGANIGDTAIIQRHYSEYPILCIEGDSFFFNLLKKNTRTLKNVITENVFVNNIDVDRKSSFKKYLGSLTIIPDDEGKELIKYRRLTTILGIHPQFKAAKLLKIDTDGFDLLILKGASDFLASVKPVIFLEYDPYFFTQQNDDGLSIFPMLKNLGYNKIMIYDNLGDYLITVSTSNVLMLQDLHNFVSGRKGGIYFDMCFFHFEDEDMYSKVYTTETLYFKTLRNF